MLLAVDIGNTNITLGLYDGEVLVFTARLATEVRRTADQYAIDIKDILALHGCNYHNIEDAVKCFDKHFERGDDIAVLVDCDP